MKGRILTSDPLLRLATELGWIIRPGRKHWRLSHPITGSTTILPFGRRRSIRAARNIESRLRAGAKTKTIHPALLYRL